MYRPWAGCEARLGSCLICIGISQGSKRFQLVPTNHVWSIVWLPNRFKLTANFGTMEQANKHRHEAPVGSLGNKNPKTSGTVWTFWWRTTTTNGQTPKIAVSKLCQELSILTKTWKTWNFWSRLRVTHLDGLEIPNLRFKQTKPAKHLF